MDVFAELTLGQAAYAVLFIQLGGLVGLAYGVASVVKGVRKETQLRSVMGIASGGIAILIGSAVAVVCWRPTGISIVPFVVSVGAVILGTIGVGLCSRKSNEIDREEAEER